MFGAYHGSYFGAWFGGGVTVEPGAMTATLMGSASTVFGLRATARASMEATGLGLLIGTLDFTGTPEPGSAASLIPVLRRNRRR